jgi:hemolysin activation/secretion protein
MRIQKPNNLETRLRRVTKYSFCVKGLPAAALARLLMAGMAYARNQPDAGSLLRQQEQLQPPTPGTLPPREPEEVLPPLVIGEGETVLVKEVRFVGAVDLVPDAELQEVVAEAIGARLDFKGLQSLVQRVTAVLKQKGWFLARAYLPRQDVTEGIIQIAILPGHLSESEPLRIEPGDKGPPRIREDRLDSCLLY